MVDGWLPPRSDLFSFPPRAPAAAGGKGKRDRVHRGCGRRPEISRQLAELVQRLGLFSSPAGEAEGRERKSFNQALGRAGIRFLEAGGCNLLSSPRLGLRPSAKPWREKREEPPPQDS